jgi:hypothetical protein
MTPPNRLKWRGKKPPDWVCTAGIDDQNEVWIPAVAAGSELEVVLVAGYDGTSLMEFKGHVFAPCSWLRREFKTTAQVCDKVTRRVRAADKELAEQL